MSERPIIIETKNLARRYRLGNEDVNALAGVDLTVRENDYLVILGASGSGKSTLMHILGFMDTPSSGEIFFDGANVSRISANKRAWYRSNRIGFVFQTFNLHNQVERAQEALARVGMLHRQNHTPNQLSGGERQRVSIARALVNRPRVIFADEPTGALDVKNVKKVLELFDELVAAGQTIVMVTHDLEVAKSAHRIIRMSDGKIVESYVTEKGKAAQCT